MQISILFLAGLTLISAIALPVANTNDIQVANGEAIAARGIGSFGAPRAGAVAEPGDFVNSIKEGWSGPHTHPTTGET